MGEADTTEPLERYRVWLGLAEDRVTLWFEGATNRGAEESIDLRALSAAVSTIKTIIELRRKLETWTNDDLEKARSSAAGEPTDEEILKLIEECESEPEAGLDQEEVPV